MAVLPIVTYRFDAIPTKIPMMFFRVPEKNLKIYMEQIASIISIKNCTLHNTQPQFILHKQHATGTKSGM